MGRWVGVVGSSSVFSFQFSVFLFFFQKRRSFFVFSF